MACKIKVLDETTINKIAAGEVIENPASVVKELVENAIDAGSTEITIEIKGGGRQLIRISDNGCGMNKDDALLSLERHATSKIRDIHDIHEISTMGFRGEAVPSIASISKLTLLTCAEGDSDGTLIIVEGGKILNCTSAAKSQGTTFEVKSLFFNVPVRKKFQRSPAYDANEILKIVSQQALAHPNIRFDLVHNGESLLTAKELNLKDRIKEVLGSEFSVGLLPVEKDFKGYRLSGFIGQPGFTRNNRTGQHLFINKRGVVSHLVSYAVREGYGTSLATNRHPVFVLHLQMDGSLVDVNVHPQKREVRLRQEQQLKEMIVSSVQEALQKSGATIYESVPSFEEMPLPRITLNTSRFQPEVRAPIFTPQRELPAAQPLPPRLEPRPVPELLVQTPTFTSRAVATMRGYVILATNDGLLKLMDQRAAHSRILYEKLSNKEMKGFSIQSLLIPYTLELTPPEAAILRENLDYLQGIGIDIREFGSNGFIIHGTPQIYEEGDVRRIVHEIVQEFDQFQGEGITKQEKEKRVALAAGRAAVSRKQKLTLQEGQSLYDQLMECKTPYLCPSGKPTLVEMTQEEIAKQFQK